MDGNGNSTQQIFNALGLVEKTILPPVNGVQAESHFHYDFNKKLVSTERPKGVYNDQLLVGEHIIDKFEREVLGNVTKYELTQQHRGGKNHKDLSRFQGVSARGV